MDAGLVVLSGLVFLGILVPVGLIFWSSTATMFNAGRRIRYDGPPWATEETVDFGELVGDDSDVPGGGLSADEESAWEELTSVSWNLPAGRR